MESSTSAAVENPLAPFAHVSDQSYIAYRLLVELYSSHLKDTEEEFQEYLVTSGVVAACAHVSRVGVDEVRGPLFQKFVYHLDSCMATLQDGGRRDLFFVLMKNYIPIEACIGHIGEWVKNSDIEVIKLLLQQGHAISNTNGIFEHYLGRHGSIDVLDYFLHLEDIAFEGMTSDEKRSRERKRILHSDIVHNACCYKNIDMLDRLLVRGYATNVSYSVTGSFPIYAVINQSDFLPMLDRLIMYGVDVNYCPEGQYSPLVFSFKEKNYECLERLVDVGARIDNERDIPMIFHFRKFKRDALLKLVEAGLNLTYRTSSGTPLEIIEKQKISFMRHDPPFEYEVIALREYREVEDIVRDIIAEQGK